VSVTPIDEGLIALARKGDRRALDRLLRQHYDRIYALCWRMMGNDADAADAAQEAMIALVRGLPRFDGRAAFSTWAYRVTANACLDELRRRGRRAVPGLIDDYDQGTVADPGPDHASHTADRMMIDEALAELPEEFRVPVVLRDLCDLDYAEIAQTLDIPPGTVRSRIARGRAALAARLGGNPAGPQERPRTQP
jgi:RNA polymerase sigma-70 factor (ECF subfamily)